MNTIIFKISFFFLFNEFKDFDLTLIQRHFFIFQSNYIFSLFQSKECLFVVVVIEIMYLLEYLLALFETKMEQMDNLHLYKISIEIPPCKNKKK
jgi:hypothetical protein